MTVFTSDGDRRAEAEIAAELAGAWGVRIESFGAFAAIDWYAEKGDRVVAVVEAKARHHAAGQFPTAFLSVRKWLALTLAGHGLDVPAYFVVRFTDGTRWAPIGFGYTTIVGRWPTSRNGCEAMVEIPIERFRPL